MIDDGKLDYTRLARLLDLAAREHRDLAITSNDPLERYQASTNVDFFTAARTAATEYLTRATRMVHEREPGCASGRNCGSSTSPLPPATNRETSKPSSTRRAHRG